MRVVPDAPAARGVVVEAAAYRLRFDPRRALAVLDDGAGERWAELRVLAALDTLDGPDETVDTGTPEVIEGAGAVSVVWRQTSSRWAERTITFVCREDELEVRTAVRGRGRLTDVSLLSGAGVLPNGASGRFPSGAWFRTLFSPSPADPARLVQPARESATISVSGGAEPGRGHWFFTPGPLCYAASRSAVVEPATIPTGPWLTFGLADRSEALRFVGFGYVAADRGFGLRLSYEGHMDVDGAWEAPAIVIGFGSRDPYEGLSRYRAALDRRGHVPLRARIGGPGWWREPIFCGWGAQCHAAIAAGGDLSAAASFSRADAYDTFLRALEAEDVVPGTIVIDDKWQLRYGTAEPDPAKWPNLRGWIDRRHARGQRVLLWWKAWDAEGLPDDLTIRTPAGRSIALDPTNPAAEERLRAAVRRMLAPAALDADGLKIDFTARTPSGAALLAHGDGWGLDLLHRLLAIVHDEATRVRPDCLLIGQTPNPAFVDVVDMIRLNDMLRLDDPEPDVPIGPQMAHRAAIVRATCPELLVDTDDWCAPNLAEWRAYTAVKPELGVPALYYATHLDRTGEPLEPADYALLRRTWAAYRRREGLIDPLPTAPVPTRAAR